MVHRENTPGNNRKQTRRVPVMHDDHCKVVWIYGRYTENVPAMYDKPKRLCKWWAKEHKNDSQYSRGVLKVVSMYTDNKTS